MFDFSGKVAVVTGGASGIGAGAVRRFVEQGAQVAIVDRNEAAARELANSLGTSVIAVPADVSDAEAVEQAFATIVGELGRLDILVCSAGIRSARSIEKMPAQEWRRVIDVNLSSSFYCLKAAIAPMRTAGAGSIVIVSSTAGKHLSLHGGANYTAAKAGLHGLARQAAFELAPLKIRVNVVCPGPTATAMSAKSTYSAARLIPMGERCTPADIANAISFFASAEARLCTGTTLDVDGGFLLANGISHDEYFAKRDSDAH